MPRFKPATTEVSVSLAVGHCGSQLTLPVDWEVQIIDLAVLAKYLVKVILVYILGQALDDDLEILDQPQ